MRRGAAWLLAAWVLSAAPPARAGTVMERFAEGVANAGAGRWSEAADAFRELHERFGVTSPDLLLDLGVAEYRAGRAGPAVLHLHRAMRTAPGTPAAESARVAIQRIRAALNQREGLTRSGFVFGPVTDVWTALFGWADARIATVVLVSAWVVFLAALSAWRLAGRGRRKSRFGVAAVVLAVAATSSAAVAAGAHRVASYRVGVTLDDDAGVYDTLGAVEKALSLPAGLEVRVEDARGGFVQVRLSSGRTGWVRESSIGLP